MEKDECIHGLGDPDWCTICNGLSSREAALARKILYRFKAKYDSKCRCGGDIREGDFIFKMGDEGYACEVCSE